MGPTAAGDGVVDGGRTRRRPDQMAGSGFRSARSRSRNVAAGPPLPVAAAAVGRRPWLLLLVAGRWPDLVVAAMAGYGLGAEAGPVVPGLSLGRWRRAPVVRGAPLPGELLYSPAEMLKLIPLACFADESPFLKPS
ncbi:hypothetical protein RHMOL_Rhmol01G0209700 [Rhododendron molle]|uniref:Uncharacterized protein n=1 Tax=Rhododendron molle TaxID=49168 RepID=A0ACC0Q569_RHOML|nr:hypothetical protein RHMOL_Rhmol01G0209700 [Rhododendron molle]